MQLRDLSKAMYLSNRDLAAHAGLDAKSVRAALDQLYSRRAIVLRCGDNKTANRIYVCLWDGRIKVAYQIRFYPSFSIISDPYCRFDIRSLNSQVDLVPRPESR